MAEEICRIEIDVERAVAEIPPTLFGGFVEHMGRCIYGGIYDPDSPHADERGLRRDVLDALREMKLSHIRYPGGNFVSGYDWRDGVGPREQRPRRRELAWQSIETNQFGTNEFVELCRQLKVEPMLAVNLGTGTISDASNLVEYCNAPVGTEFADLRAAHGYVKPHGIKYWCLGNEMDGDWQIGHLSAEDYAKKAREASKLMKWQDPAIKTILAGSSGPWMKTFPQWDRVSLEHCWGVVDYLSLHNYATNWENDTQSFLAYAVEFERHIDTLATILRETKQKLGPKVAKNDVYLSQDEWNVWYKDRQTLGGWKVAPALCEEKYNLEDALVNAQWMNVFLRKCDVVKMTCIAQLVNVLGSLKTRPEALLRETIFFPFVWFSKHARGRSILPKVFAPMVSTKRFGDVPMLDVSCAYDEQSRAAAVFVVSRAMDRAVQCEVSFAGIMAKTVVEGEQLAGLDPKVGNTFERPDVLVPREISSPAVKDGRFQIKIPPLSATYLIISK